MAKGKAAAQSANRRTTEALARVAALEATLAEERERTAVQVRQLEDELRRHRQMVQSLAAAQAREAIAQAEADAIERVAVARSAADARGRSAVDVLHAWNAEHPNLPIIDEIVAAVADAAGVPYTSEMAAKADAAMMGIDDLTTNRQYRRLTNKKVRAAHASTERKIPIIQALITDRRPDDGEG